jgi:hypothetical protein
VRSADPPTGRPRKSEAALRRPPSGSRSNRSTCMQGSRASGPQRRGRRYIGYASAHVADGRKNRADDEQPGAGPLKRERGLEGFLALFLDLRAFPLYLGP